VSDELKKMKDDNTTNLICALDLKDVQSYSYDSLERFELLQAVARGEKITPQSNHAAKYLLSKHGEIQAFLGIHPEGHLYFAVPMTKESLKQIEANEIIGRRIAKEAEKRRIANQTTYFSWWK
jgi:hypothetical protein